MQLVSRTEDLAEACARLGAAPFVAVDTEFMREQTFWPKLCLIQMAADGTEVLVDSLAPGLDLQPFFDLMVNERVLKVFHSARQDVEIVHHLAGVIPHPIFDTQVAAMVCGFGEAVSYSMLVKRLLSRNLDKTSRFTDWSRRPLSERQFTYALGDVVHLRDLYPKLQTQLDRSERASWLNEEMAVLTDPATYELHPEQAWKRLKMRIKTPKSLAVLMELAAWREREAQSQSVKLAHPRTRRGHRQPRAAHAGDLGSLRTLHKALPAPRAAAPCSRRCPRGSTAIRKRFPRSNVASPCRQRRRPWSICCACCSRPQPASTAWRRS
jgi:ribonuclease D